MEVALDPSELDFDTATMTARCVCVCVGVFLGGGRGGWVGTCWYK